MKVTEIKNRYDLLEYMSEKPSNRRAWLASKQKWELIKQNSVGIKKGSLCGFCVINVYCNSCVVKEFCREINGDSHTDPQIVLDYLDEIKPDIYKLDK